MTPLLPCRAPQHCGGYTAKYRGELRSMATRRDLKKTLSGDNRGPPSPPVFLKGI